MKPPSTPARNHGAGRKPGGGRKHPGHAQTATGIAYRLKLGP
jgi:hypothetical protein